jgi:hypothetical protein
MPSVTKTFNLVFQGVSISPDGSQITASVGWQDQAAASDPSVRAIPSSFTSVRIAGGKVSIANKEVGVADAQIASNAAAVAAAVSTLVNSLAAAGKLVP